MSTTPPKRFQMPRLTAVLVALTLALAAPLARADVPLAEIQKLIKAGQYPQALEKTDAYLAGKPRDAQGRFMKGLILTEMNRPADAVAIFTRLTEDYPELPEPYNNLAVLYAQQKQYDKARAALEMAIRTHPAYAIAYENLGDVYAKLASQAYGKALQLDASNAGAQGKLSMIHDLVSTAPRPTGGKPAAPAVARPAEPAARPTEPVKVASVEPAKPAATVIPVAPPTPTVIAPATPEKTASPAKAVEKTPAKPAGDSAPGEAEAINAVQAWAAAWSRKDVRAYLAHYAPDFRTPGGKARKAWEDERRQRIDRPGKIQVSVDNFRVSIEGDKATVRFRQTYKSASLNSTTGKTLVLVRVGGKWLIQQESVG